MTKKLTNKWPHASTLLLALMLSERVTVDPTPRASGSVPGARQCSSVVAPPGKRKTVSHFLVTVEVSPRLLWFQLRKYLYNPVVPDLETFLKSWNDEGGLDISFMTPWPVLRGDLEAGTTLEAGAMRFLVPHSLLEHVDQFYRTTLALYVLTHAKGRDGSFADMTADEAYTDVRAAVVRMNTGVLKTRKR
jgi:hypothetical protein